MTDTAPPYIVLCVGSAGDIHPFLHLAKTLLAQGRKVSFITNTYHAKRMQADGLTLLGVGSDEDYLRVVRNPAVWDKKQGFATLMQQYGEHLEQFDAAMRAQFDGRPAIVISHPITVPAAAIAREQGWVRSVVSCYLAPSTIRTCHNPMRVGPTKIPDWFPMAWRKGLWRQIEKRWIDPVCLGHLNRHRSAVNLAPVACSFLEHVERAPDLTVALFPTWFGPAMPDWPQPLLASDFPLFDAAAQQEFSAELASFLAQGDAPLVFTPGTGNLHARAFFADALAAARQLGRRAIFLTREQAQVPAALPPTVLWQPYVPLARLLPRSAALIHHGGIGTTAEALRAGTPQVVLPFGWDQYDNGARVSALGVGWMLRRKSRRAQRLARELAALIGPEGVRPRCEQLAQHFRTPLDAGALCAEIEQRVNPR